MNCKRIVSIICFLVSQVLLWAQYEVCRVDAVRYELTSDWDATPDEGAVQILTPYQLAVDSIMSPVLGESDVQLWPGRPESPLSNFVADVLLDASARVGKKADIGLCNIGGLRSSLPKGAITYGDVLAACPFDSKMVILTLKGDVFIRLMEQIASVGGEGVSHGVQIGITSDHRYINAMFQGQQIDPHAIYVIATLDFLAEGNDGLTALRDHILKRSTPFVVRELVAEAIMRAQAEGRKVTAKTEGRVAIQ